MKALLIVDLQNDFCPGGALPAPEGDTVVPVINSLMHAFPLVVASKDWHPDRTAHFSSVITSYSIHYTKLYENISMVSKSSAVARSGVSPVRR